MPEPAPNPNPESTPESLGWRAGLPDDLKQNETFKSFKTVGDFAKAHLETATKLSDAETKLKDFIPRLPDNATDEEKGIYYNALGRPEKAADYEFDGEDKNAPEWTGFWKQQFHSLGLTKVQAKQLSGMWNGQLQKMVDSYNEGRKNEVAAAESKLRTELGDKFDTNVELAKRLYKKHGQADFDTDFANENGSSRFGIIRMILSFASLTGEDRSPQSAASRVTGRERTFITYDKSPAPPNKG
jgi:hypothetical protein